ncbi:hypothetical protein [Bacillus sp. NTK034]|uniref:hypothetical protein n=1 Tax=Bacillus sp. NTK034 TaxID=2802176 RepID=UPI001A90760A|nr:hypothetical protein [Bacillus sp. NTK034]MBN8203043.1 hypothetical protein [Bacillus sp. NTK034]
MMVEAADPSRLFICLMHFKKDQRVSIRTGKEKSYQVSPNKAHPSDRGRKNPGEWFRTPEKSMERGYPKA